MRKRRPGLLALAVFIAAPMECVPPPRTSPCGLAGLDAVACENTLPGTPPGEWDLTNRSGDPTLVGYTTDISVNVGGTIHFKVDTDAADYRLDIHRLGYYGGDGARLIETVRPTAPLPQHQPDCLSDPTTGLVDCGNWAESASWAVPASAVSGLYLARLFRPDTGGNSHIAFIVRDDASRSDLHAQMPDTTWAAYNRFGGNSLYRGSPAGRAYKVSYNRPDDVRGNEFSRTSLFNDVIPMIRFLEANGYDLSYTTATDVERQGPDRLRQHKAFLSIGHDEYWSAGHRASVETARDAGVHLAFFSGNEVFWKTRWEPSIDGAGTPFRTMVSYKESIAGRRIDPENEIWTGTWHDPTFSPPADGGRPENALTGTIFMVNCCQFKPVTVSAEEGRLRFWRQTGLDAMATPTAQVGEGILGYELDADVDNGFRPKGQIALSTTRGSYPSVLADYGDAYRAGTSTHSLVYHRAPSGALVFGAGTVHWSWGLDATHDPDDIPPPAADRRIQQATVNVLADMGAQPTTLQPGLTATVAPTDTTAPASTITAPGAGATIPAGAPVTVTGRATDTGGAVGGVEVTTDAGATWHPATGRATWSYTFTPPVPGRLSVRSRATDDSLNTEEPGAGVTLTVGERVCPCTIFGSSEPNHPDRTDAVALSLGMRFRSDVAGSVTGVRFYKAPGDTAPHVGHLWTSTGELLATATFTAETASGWQEATFTAPVDIGTGTDYIVSYHSPAGRYAGDNDVFSASGVDAAPLHAPASTPEARNGLYLVGADGFPNHSYRDSNYYVDVLFR